MGSMANNNSLSLLLNYIVQRYSVANLSLTDLRVIDRFCAGVQSVVELGTQLGNTTRLLSMIADQVISVDVFDKLDLIQDEAQRFIYKVDYDSHPHDLAIVSGRLADRHNIRLIQDRTDWAVKSAGVLDGSISVLIIDADHSYDGAKNDFLAWFPKIAVGGYILFHDAIDNFPGVVQVCDEVGLRHDVVEVDHGITETSFRVFKVTQQGGVSQ